MTTAEMIRRFFKRACVDLDPAVDEAVFDRIRAAYVKASENGPAESRPVLWRHIMRRPLIQWGIAAAVIVAGLIGSVLLARHRFRDRPGRRTDPSGASQRLSVSNEDHADRSGGQGDKIHLPEIAGVWYQDDH